ncbi:hypothetical protein PAMA_017398 [Pampus argenteus]
MEVVIAVLVMLLGVCHGVETHCDGRQNGARCYGALGGTLVLRLMDNALEKFRYRWYKNETDVIFRWQNSNFVYNALENRSIFTASNGTLRINNLSRTDGAEYTLDIINSDGKLVDQTLQVLIQAPVSSVLVVPECLSQGKTRVSCSSEGGDSPQYSWTLDGRTLTDAELISGSKDTNIITLKQDVSGRLVCSVRNYVNSVSREEMISTCGVETHCDGRQNGARCYGALGGTLVLRLMDNALEKFRYRWYKNKTDVIFRWQNSNIVYNVLEDRSIFTASNGTLRINNLSRTDGAEYTLNILNSDGQGIDRTLQLLIQAPVSSVLVVPECLSQGKTRVSCSSKGGDSPQYSWTLDGRTLTDAELLSGSKDTNNITLKQDVSGRLVCSVRNYVNSVSREEMISTCDNLLLVFGVRAVVVLFPLAAIAIYFTWKKKKYEKVETSAKQQMMEHPENSFAMTEM